MSMVPSHLFRPAPDRAYFILFLVTNIEAFHSTVEYDDARTHRIALIMRMHYHSRIRVEMYDFEHYLFIPC